MNRRNFIKGLLATATCVAVAPMVSLPIQEARFLTFEQAAAEALAACRQTLVDYITQPSPVWLKLKDMGLIQS